MKKIIFVLCFALLFPYHSNASESTKPCPKSQVNKVKNNLVCKKINNVYRWTTISKPNVTNNTATPSTITPTPSPSINTSSDSKSEYVEKISFNSLCDHDPLLTGPLVRFQKEAISRNACQPPYRFVSQKVTNSPKTILDIKNISSENCKINPPIWNLKTSKWNPNYKIIVIPFQTNDYQSSNNPKSDWKDMFDYFSETIDNMTDVKSDYKIDIMDNYVKVPVSLASLDLGSKYMHGDPNVRPRTFKLAQTIISSVDSQINFASYDAIWLLPPANISTDILSNFIINGPLYTNEKRFDVGMYLGTRIDDFKSKSWSSREPFGLIHEWLVHVSNTLDDTYGDYYSTNNIGHFGTGSWGNTSGAISDFLGFDKWQLGMIDNSQVICVNPNTNSTTLWLKPLNSDGLYEKLAMIKLDRYNAISIQSMRSIGYNYKLPLSHNGVLVIDINAEKMYDNSVHADGQYVVCPKRDNSFTIHGGCKNKELNDAALKINESIIYRGYKITVIESGDFGDVIKIDKL